ncbi:protein Tob1-like [Montipora capricornis]|uniref:protein Tob1-like n=1 Tax=Montipora foliosa TaxID=591990 RepID=UPI0035F1DF0F
MEVELQVAVNFLIGYLVNKLPRRRVQLFGEEVVKRLTKKFEGHWYPEKPSKGSGYRCLLITDNLDPVLSSAAKESGLCLQDVKANLPQKLCLWIDPQEVSFRIGEQGPVKTIYKEEKKAEEICDETARWVNLLNGHNRGMPNTISPVPFRSHSPPRLMADRSSPIFSPPSTSSPSSYSSPFTYNSWSTADESSLYKFRAKRTSPTSMSANAKEFSYRSPKETFAQSYSQARSGLESTRSSFISSPVFDWFNYNELGNFNPAPQLPILA